jgi:amino acid transporter
MISSGVFTTSGFLLADLRSPWIVLAAWAIGGLQATLGALCYGALARRIPESGGEYVFLSRTLHPSAGYLAGWISLLVGFSAPLAAMAFARQASNWLPAGAAAHGTSIIRCSAWSTRSRWRRRARAEPNGRVKVVSFCFVGFAVTSEPPAHRTLASFSLSASSVSPV